MNRYDLNGKTLRLGGWSRPMHRAFIPRDGEELVHVIHDGVPELYSVPDGTHNPQDAIKYPRVAYWEEDTSMPLADGGKHGEWILDDGEPSGNTWRTMGKQIGIAL
jgi:hypothetical protein